MTIVERIVTKNFQGKKRVIGSLRSAGDSVLLETVIVYNILKIDFPR